MKNYTRADFAHANEPRWCPGCGDYAILAALQKTLPELGLAPEQHVFVSGIGCAGRLPYYMNTYGFHTLHGRATPVATGLKAMRDDLCVWVITGDGDALSIGGNHLIHCLRRNVDIKILLFNNQVYGLTKGQYSPTSCRGQITKTSPQGLTQEPLNPLLLSLASGATFVARAVDKDPAQLSAILTAAYHHRGCAFIEIYQDCHIFNPGAFDAFSLKGNRNQNTLFLEEDKPLTYGQNKEFALEISAAGCKKVSSGKSQAVHHSADFMQAIQLARLSFPEYPVPLGLFFQENKAVFAIKQPLKKTTADLNHLFRARASWRVEK